MIVIIAINRESYMAAATNLVAAILASDPWQRFTIITDTPEKVSPIQSEFCRVIEIEKGANPYLTKLLLPELIPDESFRYIDADSMWNPKFSAKDFFTFDSFSCGILPHQNLWDDAEIRKTHKIKAGVPLLAIQPSVFHFTPENKKLFSIAAKTYEKLDPSFRGLAPDSLALSIACAKLGVIPNEIPVYSSNFHRISDRDKFALWTFPGDRIREPDLRAYNLASVKGAKFGGIGKWFRK